jgi:hypothetical protein
MSANELLLEETTDLAIADRVAIEVAGGVAGQIAKSEVEAQLDAAHKYPRSVKRFLTEAVTLATYNRDIASACMYAVPRGGKIIEGPSVRLAEICIAAYGNLHVGARVIGAEDKEVVSQGVCWDLEKNNRVTIEKRRKITDRNGNRFNEDMINVTGNAAASIALRDAAFRIIPRTYVNLVYESAKKVAVGEASTLAARRDEVFQKLVKMGAMPDRILARIGKPSIEDIGIGELQALIGFGTAIHSGAEKVDDIFPSITVEKGKVDLDSIKGGGENRGHGNEKLGNVPRKGKKESAAGNEPEGGAHTERGSNTPTPAGISTPAAPAAVCEVRDFEMLEILGTENKVGPKKWKKHIEETMGFSAWELLTKDRYAEVEAYIKANKRD